jgi:hypothetical protein
MHRSGAICSPQGEHVVYCDKVRDAILPSATRAALTAGALRPGLPPLARGELQAKGV